MSLPRSISAAYQSLEKPQQKAFRREFNRRKRSVIVAYIAWLLIGWHYLYMGKVGLQFAFWFTLGGFGLWWLLDAIRLPRLIGTMNEDVARELMVQHRSLG